VREAGTKMARAKLSTTVSQETYEFLEQMVHSGEASSMADAVDRSITRIRQLENRKRLAAATARYFDQLEPRAIAEEDTMARDMTAAASEIDFDKEL
jgi:Arc/MetJ-type ribon-helix-helix transcriptional regulator